MWDGKWWLQSVWLWFDVGAVGSSDEGEALAAMDDVLEQCAPLAMVDVFLAGEDSQFAQVLDAFIIVTGYVGFQAL